MVTNDQIQETKITHHRRTMALSKIRRMIVELQRAIQRYLVEYQPDTKRDIKTLGYSLSQLRED